MAGCTLIDPASDDPCYAYLEPVSDASAVTGEWKLALVAFTGWRGNEIQCLSAEKYETSLRLVFEPGGYFERWEVEVRVAIDSSYTVSGGMVTAAGRGYHLRTDDRLVHDLSPLDGPTYVFERRSSN